MFTKAQKKSARAKMHEGFRNFAQDKLVWFVLYHFRISLIALAEYPSSVSARFKSSRVSIFTLLTKAGYSKSVFNL
jgi:hypothetical protein